MSARRLRTAACALAGLAALALPVAAHQFWLAPSAWRVDVGALVRVGVFVGEHFAGEELPRDAARIARFELHGPAGGTDVLGLEGQAPAGFLRPASAGGHVLAYASHPSFLELPGAKFDAYLEEEGLEHVRRQRAALEDPDAPVREAYQRCAKSLLRVGDGADFSAFGEVLGLRLELVPEGDPTTVSSEPLALRVLFEGRPLAGCRLALMRRPVPTPGAAPLPGTLSPLLTRTDAEGRARFDDVGPGTWLVHGVWMVPADPEGELDVDWSSAWASLTFERERRR